MITHNIKQAIESGDRLIMMHEGKIVIDVKREEKIMGGGFFVI